MGFLIVNKLCLLLYRHKESTFALQSGPSTLHPMPLAVSWHVCCKREQRLILVRVRVRSGGRAFLAHCLEPCMHATAAAPETKGA